MSTSQYTQPPPEYDNNERPKNTRAQGSSTPLLHHQQHREQEEEQAWAGHADEENDDFKYGSTVSQCSLDIRMQFIRKVYTILLVQLASTAAVAAGMKYYNAQSFLIQHTWIMFVPLLGALGTMFAVYANAQRYPANFALLGLFTIFESVSIGFVTSLYDSRIVLNALVITTIVFVALTLFAMQTKYDLASLQGYLYVGLMGFVAVGLVSIFLPYSNTMEIVYSSIGVLLFSGFVLVDTHNICKRCSPDEFIMASLSLYLDFINLFLNILRLLNSANRDN